MAYRLNNNGVKDSADRFRTFKGVRWVAWCPNAGDAREALRAKGIAIRTIDGDIFIREADQKIASA